MTEKVEKSILYSKIWQPCPPPPFSLCTLSSPPLYTLRSVQKVSEDKYDIFVDPLAGTKFWQQRFRKKRGTTGQDTHE